MFSSRNGGRVWVVWLAMLVVPAVALADNCQLARIAEVPMSVTKAGQVVVPVEIDGIHVKMALDTAGSLPFIYSGATAALNLTPTNSIRRGTVSAGATALTQTVHMHSLRMANVNWGVTSALVYPWKREFPQVLGEDDVVGSLGQNLFSGVDVELDFAAGKLRLFSQKHCTGNVVYWAGSFDVLPLEKDRLGDMYVTLLANGKPMLANISTLTPISGMEEEAAQKTLGLDRTSAGVDAGSDGDGCTSCGSILLKAQGLEIRNARVRMVQTLGPGCHFSAPNVLGMAAHYDCPGAYPLHIGMNVLDRLHLYFANGEKKLYFTDAGAPSASADPAGAAAAP